MKFIIFGSSGFIGSAIARELDSRGANVLRIDRKMFGEIFLNLHEFQSRISPDDKIILAAGKIPARDISDSMYNLRITEMFLKILGKRNFAYLLNLSSDAVYPNSHSIISEETTVNPESLHGLSQICRELMLNASFNENLGHLRITAVYGPGDTHNSYGPNRFLRDAISTNQISLLGEGEEFRSHLFINDLVELSILVMKQRRHGVLNASSGQLHSFYQISKLIQELLPDTKINFVARDKDIDSSSLRKEFDFSVIQREFTSFTPTPLMAGLADMLSSLRNLDGA